jgi:hypothetical protein
VNQTSPCTPSFSGTVTSDDHVGMESLIRVGLHFEGARVSGTVEDGVDFGETELGRVSFPPVDRM